MNIGQHTLIFAIRVYRAVLSPAMGLICGAQGRCRFTPSCSEYAMESVRRHGAIAGTYLTVRRLLRCQPWGGCGEDPAPDTFQFSKFKLTTALSRFRRGKVFHHGS